MTDPEPQLVDKLIAILDKHGGSHAHVRAGSPPVLRIDGSLRELDAPALCEAEVEHLLRSVLAAEELAAFEASGELAVRRRPLGSAPYRLDAYRHAGAVAFVLKRIQTRIPSFEDLHLPPNVLRRIANLHQGLVVVSGPSGSGRSTTLAAILSFISMRRACHIVTVEDPIEFSIPAGKALIDQREVGLDTSGWLAAVRAALHLDVDAILLDGPLDGDCLRRALALAEGGHLVLCSFAATSVPGTLEQLLDLFPESDKGEAHALLAFNLKAIVCQKLLPTVKPGVDRVPCTEILCTDATSNRLLLEGREREIVELIRSKGTEEQHDYNQSLCNLIKRGLVSKKIAMGVSGNPEQLEMNLSGITLSDDRRALAAAAPPPAPAPAAPPPLRVVTPEPAPRTGAAPSPPAPAASRPTTTPAPETARAPAAQGEQAAGRPTPVTTAAGEMVEAKAEALKRKATVRYHAQMNPTADFPLLVVLSAEEVRRIVVEGVRQATAEEAVEVRREQPFVELRPHFPGCLVNPSQHRLDVTPETATAEFWVIPLAVGRFERGRVEVFYEDRLVTTVATPYRVAQTTAAKMALACSVVLPVVSGLLDSLDIKLKDRLPWAARGFFDVVSHIGGGTAFGLLLGAIALVAAGVVYWLARPQEADPVQAFFDVGRRPGSRQLPRRSG